MHDQYIVLKNLKNNKSRDQLGLVNDLFKPSVAGIDLKQATLLLVKNIKEKQDFPETLRLCNKMPFLKKGQKM